MSQNYRQKCLAQKINACNVCGSGENLLVHHLNGDRGDNRLENLVPLCQSCHKRVHRTTDPIGAVRELQTQLPEDMQPDSGGMVNHLSVKIGPELSGRLDALKDDHEFEPNQSDVVRAALDEYLSERGF